MQQHHQHQHGQGGTSGSRPACLEPLQVRLYVFFFYYTEYSTVHYKKKGCKHLSTSGYHVTPATTHAGLETRRRDVSRVLWYVFFFLFFFFLLNGFLQLDKRPPPLTSTPPSSPPARTDGLKPTIQLSPRHRPCHTTTMTEARRVG